MPDILLNNILALILGLLTGLATGFFFERRATKEARRQHEATLQSNKDLQRYVQELEEQQRDHQFALQKTVRNVQQTVYSSATAFKSSEHLGTILTADHIMTEIRARLDEEGKTSLPALINVFISEGHNLSTINLELDRLVESGEIFLKGKIIDLP